MMQIYLHWLEMTGLITPDDISYICDCLNIPRSLTKEFVTNKGTQVCTYTISGDNEAVYISIPAVSYGKVTLRGSYFDSFTQQSMQTLIAFMYGRKGNCKRIDVSFKDTMGCIDFAEYSSMSLLDNYLDYCTGTSVACRKKKKGELPDSNNRQGIPDPHVNHKLIHYGDSNSSAYAKLYVCQDGNCKFEVTVQDHGNSKILLDAYDISDMSAFNALSLQALVKTINFVTPASKRAKRPVQIASFKTFLGSEVKPVKWALHSPAKQEKCKTDALLAFRDRLISQVWSCIPRFDIPQDDIEALIEDINVRLKPQEVIF